MIRKFVIIGVLFLMPIFVHATSFSGSGSVGLIITAATSSGEQTADALIYTGKCVVTLIKVITDGTNDAKIVVYDNTSGAGKVVDEVTATGPDNYGGRAMYFPILMEKGIYVDVTGTGASYLIEYIY